MKKDILVVSETFFPENFIINDLVLAWQEQGLSVDVLTQWPSYPEGRIYEGYSNEKYATQQWGKSTIHRFKVIEGYKESKLKKILNYWTFVRQGTRIIKQIGGDYKQIFVHQTGPLTQALVALAAKSKFSIPITIWTFDIWPDAVFAYGFPKIKPMVWFVDGIIKKVYRNYDHILVSSKRFSETINKYAPEKLIEYVPNWYVATENQKSELRLDKSKINFTFTGNISMWQNLENTVHGFAKAGIDNAVLHIVGDGSTAQQLRKLIDNEKIKNVLMHGQYPYSQMADILSESDILVMPLIADEGIEKTEPLKMQSYLAAKKPILGICKGSSREIIIDSKVGLCADPVDIDDIATKFTLSLNLIGDTNITQNALKTINTRFDKETIIKHIGQIIGV